MATLLGKLLILVHVMLSLAFAAAAFGIYSARIDWPGSSGAGGAGRSEGELARTRAEVEAAQKEAGLAQARCDTARAVFLETEKTRQPRLDAFARQLSILEGAQAGPVQVLARKARGGEVPRDENGIPKLESSSLQSRSSYLDQIKQVENESRNVLAEIDKVEDQEKAKTIELAGIPGKQKGLRDLMEEERRAQGQAVDELEAIQPIRYNYQVEGDLLEKRHQSLEARLNELKSSGVALAPR